MGAVRSWILAACCLLPVLPGVAAATVDAGGSLALTRDDIYRGVSQTCGHPAVQADLHLRARGAAAWAVFAGAWGSAGLSSYSCGAARELDVYAGYSLSLSASLGATLTYTRYTFPGGGYGNPHLAGERWDYDQLGMSLNFADRLYLTVAWTPDVLRYERYEDRFRTKQDRSAFAFAGQWRQPLVSGLSLVAGAGYDHMADPFGTGYGFWSVGLTQAAGPFQVDVAYFRAGGRAVRLFGPDAAGGRVSATLLWRF